jgi:hypothetical protein
MANTHDVSKVSRRRFLASATCLGLAGVVAARVHTPRTDTREGVAGEHIDLALVDCAHFTPYLGSTFEIYSGVGGPIDVELVRAKEREHAGARRAGPRKPFRLLFEGPGGSRLTQGTYRIEHAQLGTFALFLVPIGMPTERPVYEAIFS